MRYLSATADEIPLRRGGSFSRAVASTLAALVVASGAAAWISDFDPAALLSQPAYLRETPTPSFNDRFSADSMPDPSSKGVPARPFAQFVLREIDLKLQEAKGRLAQELQSEGWRTALVDELSPTSVAAVPLPRSRPNEANLEIQSGPATVQSDNRTLLQKLSDLFPARMTLASLGPDGGFLSDRPDLTFLGYDNFTAVYDISARAVYLPNGSKLEAHSGFGDLKDDPEHVGERDVGATPPSVYDLKPRERLFHGVHALRMIPVISSGTLGRSGLLAHSYMLGPNGDSNGCVSIKDYEKFLKAFQNGEIKRLVVVASLNDAVSASRRSASQS
jgi:hypothetical protein